MAAPRDTARGGAAEATRIRDGHDVLELSQRYRGRRHRQHHSKRL